MSNCRVLQSTICLVTQPFHYQNTYDSYWGKWWDYYHGGVDLVDYSKGYNALGYITAHTAGKVIGIETGYTGPVEDGSYGNYIWILHADGSSCIYAHLAYGTTRVSLGQWVNTGEVIAYMNNTGHSYGGHLHWEYRDASGNRLAPEAYLNAPLPGMGGWVKKIGNDWFYVIDGQIDYSYTGVAQNENGWWYCKNGKVDFTYTGLAKNENGWWYCKKGKVDFAYNGIVNNEYGWWKVVNGKVDFTFTGLAKNENGWWYLKNGKVDFSYNGIVKNENGWWVVVNGKVDFEYNGLAERTDNGTWWMIQEGKVDFGYNGLAENKNGVWVITKGKVDFDYSGDYRFSGDIYKVEKGKVKNK